MDAIETKALCKVYGGKPAVDQLTMTVREGDIYGFIGKNGAGKTTALRMLAGLARPSSGEIRIYGKSVVEESVRRRIGILIESPGLYPGQTAQENLWLAACCLGIAQEKRRIGEVLEQVGLENTGKKKVKQFSMGMKQRLGIGMALLGSPDLLLLDEPINGLDPEGMAEVRNLLEKLNREKGITILLSSHILGELSKLATRYGIIRNGRLVEEITAEEVRTKCGDYLHVSVDQPTEAAACLEQRLGILHYDVMPEGVLRIYDSCENDCISKAFLEQGILLREIYRHQRAQEEYFLEKMGGVEND